MTDPFDEIREQSEDPRFALPMNSAGDEASEASAEEDGDFRLELSRRIRQIQREVDSLKAKAQGVGRRSRGECLQLLDEVERRATRLRWRLVRARGEAGQNWKSAQAGAEASWRELRKMVAQLSHSIRSRTPDNYEDKQD